MKMQPLRNSLLMDQAAASLCRVSTLRAAPGRLRRAAFIVPILGSTALATALAAFVTRGIADPLRWPLLALLAVNILYAALTGWPTVLGFLARLSGRALHVSATPSGRSRTAVVMPIHQEDPRAVFAAVEVMSQAIAAAGMRNTDLFVLSDTHDPAIAAEEMRAFTALRARVPTLHYRRRTSNAGRKVGNLLDFCATWGGRYDYMVVLDADSLMGAGTIATLIGLMDANPKVGIVQSVPYPVGRETLFARVQQFAARLYTPMLIEGLTFWQQGDANYWGHNAIVRIAPFVAHCGLPVLPGREPFGGEILCHDVVEAGLMRGAGWDVWVLPQVTESYEALPANLIDFASRERRWCQGNLQHARLLDRPGLRPVGRFHLGYGVLHYISGPLAVLFLALATLDAATGGGFVSALLLGTGAAHGALAALVLGLLYAGKLLSLGTALFDDREARSYGGRARLIASAALEQVAALGISAMLIVFYTRYVAALLLGQTVRWDAQPRDNRGVSWAEGWMRLRGTLAVGLGWLLLLLQTGPAMLAWCAPLVFGLVMALPMAIWSSRTALGGLARRWGLFLTPEELAPPPVLRAFQRAMAGPLVPGRPHAALNGLQLAPSSADGD